MQQHSLRPAKGATHKRKRIGRGNASGHGTYSTKGMKGQKARSGGGVRPGFEGGQLPFVRRMAYKRGFRNPFRVDYEEVNVGSLASFAAGATVNAESLRAARLVQSGRPVKVLGNGDIAVALTVEADSFSKSAQSKIEAAGGSVRWLGGAPERAEAAPEAPASKTAASKAATDEAAAATPETAPAAEETPAPKRRAAKKAASESSPQEQEEA
jgi:large subunit ribosomal protein L15